MTGIYEAIGAEIMKNVYSSQKSENPLAVYSPGQGSTAMDYKIGNYSKIPPQPKYAQKAAYISKSYNPLLESRKTQSETPRNTDSVLWQVALEKLIN